MPSKGPDPAKKVAQTLGAECLASRVRFLHRSLNAIYDDAFRPLGVTAGQISILAVVVQKGQVAPVDLCRTLHMEKSTVSRNLERMRKAGWVEIQAEGRSQSISPTRQGCQLLEDALPHWKRAQKETRKLLGSDGSEDLRQVADLLRNKLVSS